MKQWIVVILVILLAVTGCSTRTDKKQRESVKQQDLQSTSDSQSSLAEDGDEQELIATSQSQSEGDSLQQSSGSSSQTAEILKLVVPEGYTLARIGMTLDDMGICTTEEFILAAETGDFSEFPLVAMQTPNPNRAYKLEGYLFPATYEIYKTDSPDTIIRKMLRHSETKITPEMRDQIAKTGYTVDEILVLASIIEKEAYERNDNPVPQEMPKISSVLHNRLDVGMQLQCDVTINYVEGAIKPFIDGDKNRYNDYYNTYKAPALPAGPICNPSMDAIQAAITPANTDYLFFLTDEDKNFYYSSNYGEHEILVEKYIP